MTDFDTITKEISYLRDLFQRKLLEDKAKTNVIQSVQDSLALRDSLDSGYAFRDLFKESLVALDRLRTEEPDAALIDSVTDELLTVFARRGLQPVETAGQMDPRFHEVIERAPARNGQVPGEIVYVERDGYMLGDRLLRPARVVVAAESSPAGS